MKMTVRPSSTSPRSAPKKASTSDGASVAVGSSRMMIRAPWCSSFTSSTRCRRPSAIAHTGTCASIGIPNRADSPVASARNAPSGRCHRGCACPSATFSGAVNRETSRCSWCTIPIPSRLAASGDGIVTGRPSSLIVPPSGRYTPAKTFIRLVLPAPFSPRSAWISPGPASNVAPSIATTSPNRFAIVSRRPAGMAAAGGGMVTPASSPAKRRCANSAALRPRSSRFGFPRYPQLSVSAYAPTTPSPVAVACASQVLRRRRCTGAAGCSIRFGSATASRA